MRANYRRRQADSVLKTKEGKAAIIDECLSTVEAYEVLFLYAMNHDEKDPHGKKRLKRIYKKMKKARDEWSAFYLASEVGDPMIDLFAMHEELKRKGIDPATLDKEAENDE